MLHFVTSYMKQNKSRKQALESAQYGLEISFKAIIYMINFSTGKRQAGIICVHSECRICQTMW